MPINRNFIHRNAHTLVTAALALGLALVNTAIAESTIHSCQLQDDRSCKDINTSCCSTKCHQCLSGLVQGPPQWPEKISSPDGFRTLGQAIAGARGFPIKAVGDLQKAKFVFWQMGLVAQKYKLKPGSGSTLSNIVIGLSRLCGRDPEGADGLKWSGWGNCGEWSYAFSEILGGAGVINRVVFADKSCEPGHSRGFTGTDTTVIVEERSSLPDRRISRRVFDTFRAAYHSPTDMPSPQTLEEWGDLPLTDKDGWQGESGSWLAGLNKPCVKDAASEKVLDDPTARTSPNNTKRPMD